MAKNRELEKPVESESESAEEEDASSDSEPEQAKSQYLRKPLPAPPKKSQPPTPSKPQQPASSSSDDEESDSEGPSSEARPLASKPMNSPQKSAAVGRLISKPNSTDSPAKSTGAKRPAEGKPVESESESAEEEDASSDSEPEQAKSQYLRKPLPAPPKKSQPPTPSKPQQPASSSSDDEESDSEGPSSEARPVASKPMNSPQKSAAVGRLISKPNSTDSPAKSTGAKRPAEGKRMEAKDSKRSKKRPEPQAESSVKKPTLSGGESKKLLFQRVWSEDDEIVILEGMAEYAEEKGSDPVADLNAFHDFIKEDLHVDVTRSQLQDKIRRLKKKYENNKSKEREGKDKTFSKPHEQKSYELSKIVWGSDKGKETGSPILNGSTVRKNPSRKDHVVEDGHSREVKSSENANGEWAFLGRRRLIPYSETVEESILRAGAEFFEGDRKLEGAREWRKLRQEEVELHLRKLDLLRAQTKLVLDVWKSA